MSQLRFHFDRIANGKAYGWAINEAAPLCRPFIRIAINGIVIASEYANVYRQDLREINLGDGAHGFEIYLGEIANGELTIFADSNMVFLKSYASTFSVHAATYDVQQEVAPLEAVVSYLPHNDISLIDSLFSERHASALFIFGVTAFYPRIQRHQQLAYAFTQREFDVFFIEPIFRGGDACRIERLFPSLNLYLLGLPTCGRSADFMAARFDDDIVRAWVDIFTQLTQRYSVNHSLWGAPHWWQLMQATSSFDTRVFDYLDDYSITFSQSGLTDLVGHCLNSADGVSYTSAHLPFIQQLKNKKHAQIRNGFSSALLAMPKPCDTSAEFGYVGALDEVNGDWLTHFLYANQGAALIMGSGSLSESISHFSGVRENTHFCGEVTYLKAMLALLQCRFGVIFFRAMEIAQWVNPVKCYEYIALGLPILASHDVDIEPELRPLMTIVPCSALSMSVRKKTKAEQLFWQTYRQLDFEQYNWQKRGEQVHQFLLDF